jgi:hypothetical protein
MSADIPELIRLARKGREAEETNKVVGGCIARMILTVIWAFIDGLLLMLAVMYIRRHWIVELPPLQYLDAVVIVALLRGVFDRIPIVRNKK